MMRVFGVVADAVPLSKAPLTSVGTMAGVLEIAGERATELELQAGSRVEWGG